MAGSLSIQRHYFVHEKFNKDMFRSQCEDTITRNRNTRKHGRTNCSLIEGDLDHHETEIDFG